MAGSHVLIEDYAGVQVVTFTESSILDAGTIGQIAKKLYDVVEKRSRQKLILDFRNVKFLASQMLGILLTLNKKAGASKGSLALCGLRKELMKVFEITKLEKVFKFFPDDAAALASFHVYVE